jgi:hypothetical protein
MSTNGGPNVISKQSEQQLLRCASANGLHWARLSEEPMEEFEAGVIAAAWLPA